MRILTISILLSVLVGCSSISKVNLEGDFILSNYHKSNSFIYNMYNQFGNEKLGVSIDLHASYEDAFANLIKPEDLQADAKVIKKGLGIDLLPENFVFRLQENIKFTGSTFNDLKVVDKFVYDSNTRSSNMYFIPKACLPKDSILHDQKESGFTYNIYSVNTSRGVIILLFRIVENTERFERRFRDECDFTGKNIMHDGFYKMIESAETIIRYKKTLKGRGKNNSPKNKEEVKKCAEEYALPKTHIVDTFDYGKVVRIEIPSKYRSKIKKGLYLSIYKQKDMKAGDFSSPIGKHKINSSNFEFFLPSELWNIYLIISDEKDNIHEVLYLHI